MAELLFAVEGNDVTMFATVAEAEDYLEATDVAAGEYRLYTANGQQLAVQTQGDRVLIGQPINVDASRELVAALRTYILAVPLSRRSLPKQAIASASLEQLVEEMRRIESRFHGRRMSYPS